MVEVLSYQTSRAGEQAFDVVLLPTFAQVEDWRKRHASEGAPGLFSQTVTTFNAWVADLWELHGDGSALVDSLQREVVMQAAFEQTAQSPTAPDEGIEEALTVSPGVVPLAAKCARLASGVPAFERAVEQALCVGACPGLALRESALLRGVGRYYELLDSVGLVELGRAAAYLAERQSSVFSRPVRILVANAAPLSWVAKWFFESCENLSVTVWLAAGQEGVNRVPDGVQLRFGFPSGRYAQPALVCDSTRAFTLGHGTALPLTAVVACKDPLALYKQVEAPLSEAGMRVSVQAQVPFSSTDFGRQYLQMASIVQKDTWSTADLADVVKPPFSGIGASDALRIDKELRANRLAQREECMSQLRIASDVFSQLEDLATDPEADILLGVFEQIAYTTPGRSDAWRSEQLVAAKALRSCTSVARRVGASIRGCARVLENALVSVSFEGTCAERGPHARVIVTTQAAAAQMGAGSCDQLIVCDLTSEDYPVADKDDAAATLFLKLGLAPTDTALARARRTFSALQSLPVSQLFCVRPLNDWDGNPTYPSAVLQELIDAYRADATSDDDVDEVLGLPDALLGEVAQRGEELLFANALAAEPIDQQAISGVTQTSWGSPQSPSARAALALPRRGEGGRVAAGFSPSPSQVEAYLECPRKWFVQNRLNVEDLEEGFGALERGSFAHSVLQEFYVRFQRSGQAKVLPENLERAKELLGKVADELEAEQYSRDPGSGRYVAASQIEKREVETCKAELASYLDFEAQFLPGFHPAYLEYPFRLEDEVMYAGHPFVGIIDRIDVDDAGNAVVIDYKGTVDKAHQIAGKDDAEPGKVQARMYAQVVRRTLGLNVVGALYVSYGKTHACAGAFDPRSLEGAHLPAMKLEDCSCAACDEPWDDQVAEFAKLSFSQMLDRTEQIVERAIAAMEAGEVEPAPSTQDACKYCPAAECPLKQA